MMSTSEDEPLSPKGRLRPRRLSAAGPPRRRDGRVRKEKNKHASKPSKVAPVEEAALAESVTSTSSPILKAYCPYCVKKFTSKRSISKHVKRIHHHINSKVGNYIGCQYCAHSEADPDGIVQHMVGSHPDKYFACLECHTRTSTASELEAHAPHCDRRKPLTGRARPPPRRRPLAPSTLPYASLDDRGASDSSEFNGIVISCELKPSQNEDAADIEDNITTNLILPPSKNIAASKSGEKNAVIVLDDIQWNKKIAPNLSSFHNSDAEQILSRLGVVHRAPRAGGGDLARKDWQKHLEDTTKFEKCFDTSFYSKVASNVHENLAKYLDGSFNRPLDPDSVIKTRKSKNSVLINTAEGFPILLDGKQCARSAFDSYLPRALAPKHKWKWDNPETDKNPLSADQIKRDSHANNCIITLISSLDIWTQLCMRQKYEDKFNNISFNEKKTEKNNVICNELKEILESREIPQSLGGSVEEPQASTSCADLEAGGNFLRSLGLAAAAAAHVPPPALLSGEWVRPRCYVCCACGEKAHDAKSLSSHISSQHPNAQVSHYDIGGELHLDPEILKHFNVPPSPTNSRSRPLRGIRECTKCKKPVSLEELHQHMLECAGDAPVVKRKCRYRPFGVRRRRTRAPVATALRAPLRKDVRRKARKNHIRPRAKVRTEVGDGETIRKMLADLPPKRHRVNVNAMNQANTSKKRDLTRKTIFVKRRSSEDPKQPKLPKGKQQTERRETKNQIKNEKVRKDSNSASQCKDSPTSNLRPRLARCNKSPRKPDNTRMKAKINTRPRTRQTKEKTENSDSDSESKDNKSVLSAVQTEQISSAGTPQKVDVKSGSGGGRQHAGRSTRSSGIGGGGGAGGRSSRATPSDREISASGPQSAPLKHSIASLTANTETHDKSVQFQPHFLVNQDCYKNIDKSYTPHLFYPDETPAVKLDKPPLTCHKSPVESLACQKSKFNKPRKGLNDCIAMLKNKLEDPVPCVFTSQRSVQCDIAEQPTTAVPPANAVPAPPPPVALVLPPPAAPAPPAALASRTETDFSDIPIPPAHVNASSICIISAPLDLSGKSNHAKKVTNTSDYETLDLSKKNVSEYIDLKDDEDFVVDLSIRSTKSQELPEDVTLDLSSKAVRIKDDKTNHINIQREIADSKNSHSSLSTNYHAQDTGQVAAPYIAHGIDSVLHKFSTDTTASTKTDKQALPGINILSADQKMKQEVKSQNIIKDVATLNGDTALEMVRHESTGQPLTGMTAQNHFATLGNSSLESWVPSKNRSNLQSPAVSQAQNHELAAVPTTSGALVTSTSEVALIPQSAAGGSGSLQRGAAGKTELSEDSNDKVAMLPKEIVDILGKMPDNHREQLLSVLPQYMVHNAAIKQLKLVVDIRPDAVMTPIDSRRTTPPGDIQQDQANLHTEQQSTSTESNTDVISSQTTTNAESEPCPPELLNVDTERYLIDPVTGAITERGAKEPEQMDTVFAKPEKTTKTNEAITANVQILPPVTGAVEITASSTVNPPISAQTTTLSSPDKLKEVKEKTASLRAVRIKTSDRRRKLNSSVTNVHLLPPPSVVSQGLTKEPNQLISTCPSTEPQPNDCMTQENKIVCSETPDTALVPSHYNNAENDHQECETPVNGSNVTNIESESSKSMDSKQRQISQSEENKDNLVTYKKNELYAGNETQVDSDEVSPIPIAPATSSSAAKTVTVLDTPIVPKLKSDDDSDDDVSLADIVKQKNVNQLKTNKSLRNKIKVSKKSNKQSENFSTEDSIILKTNKLTRIENPELEKPSEIANHTKEEVAAKPETAVADDDHLLKTSNLPDCSDDGKKRRSRRNKTNKSYNENYDLNLPFLTEDYKEDCVKNPNQPVKENGDNNNDLKKPDCSSEINDDDLKKQDCYETIVIDSQTEESQDNSVHGDSGHQNISKPTKRTRNRRKHSTKKDDCNISDGNQSPLNKDLDTPEDSHYASDLIEHSSTARSTRFRQSMKKDSPKAVHLHEGSQSSIETNLPLRRSRRGKSLFVEDNIAPNQTDAFETILNRVTDGENKTHFTKKKLIFSKLMLDEGNSTKQIDEDSEKKDNQVTEVPSKILKNHSDPSNELNASENHPIDCCNLNEDKPIESQMCNKSIKSRRKKSQVPQKDSKKRRLHAGNANETPCVEDSIGQKNMFDTDDTVASIVSNDMTIVDENEKPVLDTVKILEKPNETDKSMPISSILQNSSERIGKNDSDIMPCGDVTVLNASRSESPKTKPNRINSTGKGSTINRCPSLDSVHNSPQPKKTRLSRTRCSEPDDYDFSDKDTNISSNNDFSDTEINNGFLQKLAKPMTCYDIPVAAARTRSKTFSNKTISEDYDPYDINLEDKLFDEAPLIKKTIQDISLEAVRKTSRSSTSRSSKSSKPSKKKMSRKTEEKCIANKLRNETATSEEVTLSTYDVVESDDSSKSDVPLKKFVSDFAKNSKFEPKESATNLNLEVEASSPVIKSIKPIEKIERRKSKRELSKHLVNEATEVVEPYSSNSFNEVEPNNSFIENQDNSKLKSCEEKLDPWKEDAVNKNLNSETKSAKKVSKANKKLERRAARIERLRASHAKLEAARNDAVNVPVMEPCPVDLEDAVSPDAAKFTPALNRLPIEDQLPPLAHDEVQMSQQQNTTAQSNEHVEALANKPTKAQTRSEQFLESFGFFAERQPRKSNLLASKKIAETFHIIESEELKIRKRPSKKNERRKSVTNIVHDSPSTSAQVEPPSAVPKDDQIVPKKPEPKPVRNCDVCKKIFRRPDNLMRHQITTMHIAGSLEISSEKEEEEPDYLIIFRHRLDRLRKTKIDDDKGKKKGGKKTKSQKDTPLRYDIIAEAKLQTKHIMSSNKTVARRGLSRDEELFLDCCELLNKCEAAGVEGAAAAPEPRSASPAQGPSGLASLKTFDRLISEDRCDSQSDGDVDSITAQNILESEEVRSLENDLILGLKEAAEKKMASQRAVAERTLEIGSASVVVRVNQRCINCRTLELFKEYCKIDNRRQVEVEPEIGQSDGAAERAAEVVEVCASPEPPLATSPPPPTHLSPPGSTVTTERKRKKSESMIMEQFDIVDMFEDKFDKIKRKCRSQAAAAKQTTTMAEAIKSIKQKKKIDKKKNKKCSKKKVHGTIPTKGALKGFDGIKVSIPTSDIDISALVPNLPAAVTDVDLMSARRRKKVNSKKRRSSNKAEINFPLQFDDMEGATTSSLSKLDVYEFSDNEQDLLELRPGALKSKSKAPTPRASPASPAALADDSSASASDNDDFVYMSDDYLCSADETETSLLSCETGTGGKLTADSKKTSHKKKDAVDKNAVMGKIFKNNAVRTDKKGVPKTKEVEKSPKANLDQLFDSLLEDEPNSSLLQEDSEPHVTSTPVSCRIPSALVAAPEASPEPAAPVDALTDMATQTSDMFEKIVHKPREEANDKKTAKKKKLDSYHSVTEKSKPQKKSKRQSLDISEKEVFERYSEVIAADRSANDTPDAVADRSDLSLLNDSGVARHRARRKCAVGKQNVLAETWSSESEPDEGFSGRASGADASGARRKRAKKSGVVASSGRRNRHVSFKKQETPPATRLSPLAGAAGADSSPASAREGRGRSRSEVAYYWSSEEEAPGPAQPPPQHGWIVGDSHKKLVTMLAHAKGRKRDEKRHYLE